MYVLYYISVSNFYLQKSGMIFEFVYIFILLFENFFKKSQ